MRRFFLTCGLMLTLLPGGEGQEPVSERHFMLARDLDLEAQVNQLETMLGRERYEAAAGLLAKIIAGPSERTIIPTDLDRNWGLMSRVRGILLALPSAAKKQFADTLRPTAESLLSRGLARRDRFLLKNTAHRFPCTEFSQRALHALARIALEAGAAEEAITWFRKCREEHPDDQLAAAGLALSRQLGGHPPGILPADLTISLAGQQITGTEFLTRITALPPRLQDQRLWPDMNGMGRNMAPPPPSLPLSYIDPLKFNHGQLSGHPLHAVTEGNCIYICPGEKAMCLDLLTLQSIWTYSAPQASTRTSSSRSRWRSGTPSMGNKVVLAGTLCKDLFICPLQVDNVGHDNHGFGLKISSVFPLRRLHAFRQNTGELVWSHASLAGAKGDDLATGWDVAGPPLSAGDRIFVTTVNYGQTVSAYLCCFTAATGKLIWRTRICSGQQQLNMFGNALTEYAASPLTYHEGVIYGATNLGVAWALGAETGEIRWLTFYNSHRPKDLTFRETFRPSNPPPKLWANNPPIVYDDEVVFAPADSSFAFAICTSNGRQRWRLPSAAGSNLRLWHVLGKKGNRLYFSGRGVVAFNPSGRRGLQRLPRPLVAGERSSRNSQISFNGFRLPNDPPLPRGGLGPECIYTINAAGQLAIWSLDGSQIAVSRPPRKKNRASSRPSPAGNILALPGVVLTTSLTGVATFFSTRNLITLAEKRLKANPHDPFSLCTLAEALISRGEITDLKQATDLLEKALIKGSAHKSLRLRIASKLRNTLLTRLRIADNRGDTEGALTLAGKVIDLSPPGNPELQARLILAELLQRSGATEKWVGQLEIVVSRFGDRTHTFADGDQAERVAPRLLAMLAMHFSDSPAGAPRALGYWRRIIDGYYGKKYNGETAGRVAAQKITALIGKYGTPIYSEVEKEAKAALAAARRKNQPQLLRQLIRSYPNSKAAGETVKLLLAAAVDQGDLKAMLAGVNLGNNARQSPYFLRRFAAAAQEAGNPWLARALFSRLAKTHGGEKSDYPPDQGLTYAQLFATKAPVAPRPAEKPLTGLPSKDYRVLQLRGPRSVRAQNRALRPLLWRRNSVEPPLIIAFRFNLRAKIPSLDKKALKSSLWNWMLPGTIRASAPSYLFEDILMLRYEGGIGRIKLQPDQPVGRYKLPTGASIAKDGFYARAGLTISVTEEPGSNCQRILVVEPFTGAVWGETRLNPSPETRVLVIPGPDIFYAVYSRDEGGMSMVEVQAFDPVTMSLGHQPGLWEGRPLPIDPILEKRNTLVTASHLVLPTVTPDNQQGIQAFPLAGKYSEWSIDFNPGTRLNQLTARGNQLISLTREGSRNRRKKRTVIRILNVTNGEAKHQVTLGAQPLLLTPPTGSDPWGWPTDNFLFILSGRQAGTRMLHGFDLAGNRLWERQLYGNWQTHNSSFPPPTPVLGKGLGAFFFPTPPGHKSSDLYILNPTTGNLLSQCSSRVLPGGANQLLVLGENLLITSGGGQLGLFSLNSKQVK